MNNTEILKKLVEAVGKDNVRKIIKHYSGERKILKESETFKHESGKLGLSKKFFQKVFEFLFSYPKTNPEVLDYVDKVGKGARGALFFIEKHAHVFKMPLSKEDIQVKNKVYGYLNNLRNHLDKLDAPEELKSSIQSFQNEFYVDKH